VIVTRWIGGEGEGVDRQIRRVKKKEHHNRLDWSSCDANQGGVKGKGGRSSRDAEVQVGEKHGPTRCAMLGGQKSPNRSIRGG